MSFIYPIFLKLFYNIFSSITSKRFPHAKLVQQTPHLLSRIASLGLHRDKGECFEAGSFSVPISLLLTPWCGRCDYILPFVSVTVVWLPFKVGDDVDQPELPSSVAGLLQTREGEW